VLIESMKRTASSGGRFGGRSAADRPMDIVSVTG
jgi:hypothetical protein